MAEVAITYIGKTVGAFLVKAGVSAKVAGTIGAVVGNIVFYGGLTAVSYALSRPNTPSPGQQKIPFRQPIMPRQSGFGRARLAGPYMLFEEYDGDSFDVVAFHDGKIEGIVARYLDDDAVTIGSGSIGNYSGSDVVQKPFATRQYEAIRWNDNDGSASQTAHAGIVDIPTWSADHRGDGVASIGMRCYGVKREKFGQLYPNGLPKPSVVADLQWCFDPREVSHDPDDDTTWEWSDNPVLHLLTYLIRSDMGGMGFDYARRIEPSVDYWTAAADVCDESVNLKAGGSHKRYTAGGVYLHTTDPAEVIKALLDACDGWMGEAGDGSLIVYAGKYAAPTVTITDDHIISYAWSPYRRDEEAINYIEGSYTSPAHKYEEIQADPWIDQDDIDARGKERHSGLSLSWVQSHGQCRRLMKRAMLRANSGRGVIVTNLFGLQVIGDRYITIQNSAVPSMSDIVAQVENIAISFASGTVEIQFVVVTSAIDDWNPATEEGDEPPAGNSTTIVTPSAPTIDHIDVVAQGGDLRMQVNVDTPTRISLSYVVRYRQSLGGSPEAFTDWKYENFFEPDETGATVPLLTGVVAEGTYEVEAAYITATGALTDFSDTETVAVSLAETPIAPSEVETGTV